MSIPTELAQLLDRNEYRVVITKTDQGCLTEFPTRTEMPILAYAKIYQEFTEDGVACTTYDSEGTELFTQDVSVPSYAQKVWTVYNVISNCMAVGYGPQAIKFKVGENEVDERGFLSAHVSPFAVDGDDKKEQALQQLIGVCFQQGFTEQAEQRAKKQGLLEGYLAIFALFISPEENPNE